MPPKYPPPKDQCIFLENFRGADLWLCIGRIKEVLAVYEGKVITALADKANGGILAYALSVAKQKNLYRSNLEKALVPEESKLLHIVFGKFDDKEWAVRAFRDAGSAETYARACEARSIDWRGDDHPPYKWSLLDPLMINTQYTVTKYFVKTVPIALRPEELDSSNEVCPICRHQVYVTSQGKVCENGHEVFI